MTNAISEREPHVHEPDGESHRHEAGRVRVTCDYLSADEPIVRLFSASTVLTDVKKWAREKFVPVPPSDKTYYLNDDKTRHRFTEHEEHETLEKLGYCEDAYLRLNEEQVSGARA